MAVAPGVLARHQSFRRNPLLSSTSARHWAKAPLPLPRMSEGLWLLTGRVATKFPPIQARASGYSQVVLQLLTEVTSDMSRHPSVSSKPERPTHPVFAE